MVVDPAMRPHLEAARNRGQGYITDRHAPRTSRETSPTTSREKTRRRPREQTFEPARFAPGTSKDPIKTRLEIVDRGDDEMVSPIQPAGDAHETVPEDDRDAVKTHEYIPKGEEANDLHNKVEIMRTRRVIEAQQEDLAIGNSPHLALIRQKRPRAPERLPGSGLPEKILWNKVDETRKAFNLPPAERPRTTAPERRPKPEPKKGLWGTLKSWFS